jgi:hypothetical protein
MNYHIFSKCKIIQYADDVYLFIKNQQGLNNLKKSIEKIRLTLPRIFI